MQHRLEPTISNFNFQLTTGIAIFAQNFQCIPLPAKYPNNKDADKDCLQIAVSSIRTLAGDQITSCVLKHFHKIKSQLHKRPPLKDAKEN